MKYLIYVLILFKGPVWALSEADYKSFQLQKMKILRTQTNPESLSRKLTELNGQFQTKANCKNQIDLNQFPLDCYKRVKEAGKQEDLSFSKNKIMVLDKICKKMNFEYEDMDHIQRYLSSQFITAGCAKSLKLKKKILIYQANSFVL